MSVVERARIVRVPTEAQLERALSALLEAPAAPPASAASRPGFRGRAAAGSGSGRRRPGGDAGARRGLPAAGDRGRPATALGATGAAAAARGSAPGRLAGRRRMPTRRPRQAPADPRPADVDATRTAPAPPRPSRAVSLAARRAVRFVVHNWPLKLAAIALATLLYAGSSRRRTAARSRARRRRSPSTSPPGPSSPTELRDRRPDPVHRPARRRPAARGGLPGDRRPRRTSRRRHSRSRVRVAVTAVDPRVTILDFQPRSIQRRARRAVVDQAGPGRRPAGAAPDGVEVGEAVVHADRGHGHRARRGREPRRSRPRGRRHARPGRASTSTATSSRGRSTTAARSSPASSSTRGRST